MSKTAARPKTTPKARTGNYSGRPQSRLSAFGTGYSRFVRVSKIVLPLIAFALIFVVFARLSGEPKQAQMAERPPEEKTTPGQVEMIKARYEGVDEQGRRYTLTAQRATRDMKAAQAVMLEKPEADLSLKDGGWISVRAAKGRFDNKAEKLALAGGVAVFHDSGYEMHLQNVAVDMAARHAVSRLPVKGQGPLGVIEAANIDILRAGELIVFGGPAKLKLHRVKVKEQKG